MLELILLKFHPRGVTTVNSNVAVRPRHELNECCIVKNAVLARGLFAAPNLSSSPPPLLWWLVLFEPRKIFFSGVSVIVPLLNAIRVKYL